MFSSIVLAALIAPLALVRADPNPTAPGPNSTFTEGTTCSVTWDPDTSGVWTVMNIEFMSGDNLDMVYMTTVATVDGTDASNTTFNYPCPAVHPNAPIYFYQFSSPFSKNLYWTTRFAIADTNGQVTPAPNATQPNGQAIPWGVGVLDDPSQAVPSPSFGQSASATPTGSSGSASTASSSPAGAAPASGSGTGTTGSSTPGSSSAPPSSVSPSNGANVGSATNTSSASHASNSSPANAARAGVAIDTRLFQAVLALGIAAVTFAVAL